MLLLAQRPPDAALISPHADTITVTDGAVFVGDADRRDYARSTWTPIAHIGDGYRLWPLTAAPLVAEGAHVTAGQVVTAGTPAIEDLLFVHGPREAAGALAERLAAALALDPELAMLLAAPMLSLLRHESDDPPACRPLITEARHDELVAAALDADDLPPIATFAYAGYDQLP
jgi:hypothetical protein